ncbi:hypothetical protein JT359_05900 [Candidatus Poribacteria bacterium]|nr:hypothetical protein [Candidatus Poribacteria bacterium]
MSAKSFLRIHKNSFIIVIDYPLLLINICIFLIVGCSNSDKNVREEWETVLKGNWSAHLYDVFFISDKEGWIVGNSVGNSPHHVSKTTLKDNEIQNNGEAESIILHTLNGGEGWTIQNSRIFGKPLKKVYFTSSENGWSIGEDGVIIHTTDGGDTWNRIQSNSEYNLNGIFIDDNIGWIVGDWGTLLKSIDNGKSFEKVDSSSFQQKSLKAIYFIDKIHGWIITSSNPEDIDNPGSIFHTNDGGKTWSNQLKTDRALFGIHFTDLNTGWVVGDKRAIYTTSDGGKNWIDITKGSNIRHKDEYGQPEHLGNEPLHTFTLYNVDFSDIENGWIVGDLGVILHTTFEIDKDNVRKWKHQRGGPRYHNSADGLLLGLDFVSNKKGWVVGENGTILHTRNGGVTWESQSNPTHLLFDICTVSETEGYVVGDRGTILRSDESGFEWKPQDSRTPECFGGTYFITPDKGWAVAEAGVILHTSNSGAVWEKQNSNSSQDLLTVFFIDELTGWCAGSGGEILHTSNGGLTWESQSSGVSANLFDIHFTSRFEGWVTGIFGTLLHTTDGGNHWKTSKLSQRLTDLGENSNIWFNAVYFHGSTYGWVVGENGNVFHTNDSGNSWYRQESNTDNFLYDVHFISKSEGWIVGKDGIVLHTKDSGKNWRPQRTDTRTDLTSIHMYNASNGFVAGQYGTILKYKVTNIK